MTALIELTPEKIQEIAELFTKRACNVGSTCKAIGISRTTWYNWKEATPEFEAAIKDAQEDLIELAESKLFQNIMEGKETSLIFFLKNKKPQDWHDRKEIDMVGSLKLIEVDR